MSDLVDHALLPLKKAAPHRPRRIVIVHTRSGAKKEVEYLGTAGLPLRAQIFWPIAGDYLVSPRTGTIVGGRKNAEKLRAWKVCRRDLAFIRSEYRLARARAALGKDS